MSRLKIMKYSSQQATRYLNPKVKSVVCEFLCTQFDLVILHTLCILFILKTMSSQLLTCVSSDALKRRMIVIPFISETTKSLIDGSKTLQVIPKPSSLNIVGKSDGNHPGRGQTHQYRGRCVRSPARSLTKNTRSTRGRRSRCRRIGESSWQQYCSLKITRKYGISYHAG